jgi:hypothetical protein
MQQANIFEFLDWVLKKNGKDPIYENNITPYIFNRWLSMSDADISKILNVTTNRWDMVGDDDNFEKFLNNCKFYKTLLPKIHTKIKYIKKKQNTEETDESLDLVCKNYEISKREIKLYNNLVEKLNGTTN